MDANFVIKMIIRRMENIERDFKRSMLEDTYLTAEAIDNEFMTSFYLVHGMKISIEEMIKMIILFMIGKSLEMKLILF